jgi:hypothetical protein
MESRSGDGAGLGAGSEVNDLWRGERFASCEHFGLVFSLNVVEPGVC